MVVIRGGTGVKIIHVVCLGELRALLDFADGLRNV